MIDLITAGISIQYAAESAAGTRPTTGYTKLAGIKTIPEVNPEPATYDATTLDDTEWKRYIPGLKDPGGALQFGANASEEFSVQWEKLCEEAATAKEAGKAIWFAIVVPGLTKSFYFSGEPAERGFAGAEIDAVLEDSVYITPTKIAGWAAAPTASAS